MRYLVWKVECASCQWDEICDSEDEGSIPAKCPSCGREGAWWDEDAEE